MTVSFYPAIQDTISCITCACGDARGTTMYVSEREAYDALYVSGVGVAPVCGDDLCGSMKGYNIASLEETPEVNVSNVNAIAIFDILGISVGESFSERCSGVMNAEAFLGRVLMADAVQPVDAGVPVIAEGNMVHFGREEGYLNNAVASLREVAEYAQAHNLEVCWG
jgi:hypothetical protein